MKNIALLIFGLFIGTFAMAQNSIWSVTYDMALPLGDSKEFADAFSGRGFSVDGRSLVTDHLAIGGSVGWNLFYEKREKETLVLDNYTLYGSQWRYLNNLPIYATAAYVSGTPGSPRALLGMGVGTIWTEERLEVGVYNYTQNSWHFAFAPEVGFLLPLNRNVNITVKAKYQYGFKTSSTDAVQYVGFSVGFCWTDYIL